MPRSRESKNPLQLLQRHWTKLVNACSTELDKAEQQVVKLMKGPDGAPVELPFESTED